MLNLDFENDGEFYMNYNRDFLRYFGEVEIVHKTPGRMMDDKKQSSERSYDVMYFPGSWSNRGGTAGGCGNDSIGVICNKINYLNKFSCIFRQLRQEPPVSLHSL